MSNRRFNILLVLLIFFVHCCPLRAQFATLPRDARSAALGGAHGCGDKDRHVAIGYRHGYMLTSMAVRTIEAVVPLGVGVVETWYSHFGDSDYSEQQASVGYSLALGDRITAGVSGRYLRLVAGDGHYLPQQWLAVGIAARAMLGRSLYIDGAADSRPWDKSSPWRIHIGMGYRPLFSLLTIVEVEYEENVRLRCGAEYCYQEHYFLRAGFSTAPVEITFGLGARMGNWSIDLAAADHQVLGITPQLSLALWF